MNTPCSTWNIPSNSQLFTAALCSAVKETTDGKAALTLSCGIRSLEDYRRLRSAGADRYLMGETRLPSPIEPTAR